MKEISTRMISDVIKDFNTEELIEYLKKKNLKLEKFHFKILRKEEIAGSDFLNTSKEEFQSYGMKAGLAKRLAEFIKNLGQKLRNYSSLKTLDDLKEMLRRNKVNRKDITSIKQFTSVFEEINDNNKALDHYMKNIILKLSNVKGDTLDINDDQAFGNDYFNYIYGIVTTGTEWHFIIYTPDGIFSTSGSKYQINLIKSVVKDNPELLRSNMKRAENAEVKAKYIKVMDENAEVKAENAKFKCVLEEHEARFTRLEQRDKEKTNLIAKIDDDIKEIKQSLANASSVKNPNNVVRLDKLEKMAKPSNTSDSTFNSNACKPIRTETKSLEDKETDDFLDEQYKRKVSDEIRQRKREKKLQGELIVQESSPAINTSCIIDLSTTSTGLVT
ncbi:hypothetical protein RhiirA4_550285, partial [Rhizophagus irregularis]